MIHFKRASEIPLNVLVDTWNKGFEGYYVNLNMTLSSMVSKCATEDIVLDASIIMYDDDVPIGFTLNGIREMNKQMIAWNGGTGIAPEYRGRGLGKPLLEESIKVYKELGVTFATLEAFLQNTPAIKLYKSCGYKTVDHLMYLVRKDESVSVPFSSEASLDLYDYKIGAPIDVHSLPFYNGSTPWQTQWQTLKSAQSLILLADGVEVGYALFKRAYNKDGELTAITLFQCEVAPDRNDRADIYLAILSHVYSGAPNKTAFHLSKSSKQELIDLLLSHQFVTQSEFVYMTLPLGDQK
ncbi:GNAT family N-acetyltransferase [Paenibacillus sediminis]|uniref:GNAT superfamily N-acetyltransferase n=1 Tax=Paenibacillus sediminis TaxID=664909 RepID=A0ABS4H2T2_9BACL|nr:GNAT family N-acetyltransferase [Paenibacillus sediminis]MBP1936818.1 GNAT superfamily N-acetyltransferase [Paenibacillus sediminis]